MAKKEDVSVAPDEQAAVVVQLGKRLDMLDQRLDNIDSVVSAVAERVMRRPITLRVTCSKCGQNIEIAIIGNEKPS